MNKNIVYLIATVLAIVIVTLLAKQGDHPAPVNPAALPTNGMTTSAPAPAVAPANPEAAAPQMPDASMPSPAPAPAEGSDEVPQGAEVNGDTGTGALPNDAGDGKDIPPSEGQ